MKAIHRVVQVLLIVMALSCAKDDGIGLDANPIDQDPQPPIDQGPQLKITKIEPTHARKGVDVHISISGFDPNSTGVRVYFNGKEGDVISKEESHIIAIVPPLAPNGALSVSVEGKTIIGPIFHYVETLVPSTYAGSSRGDTNGTAFKARFNSPRALAMDKWGNMYLADKFNHKIKKIYKNGTVSTLAGTTKGFKDGAIYQAQLDNPSAVAVDSLGNVYIADSGNHRIRMVTNEGEIHTIAGGEAGFSDGLGGNAQFRSPSGLTMDREGTLYISDSGNNSIRKMTREGLVTTIAGDVENGYADGERTEARFYNPMGICVDQGGILYVADNENQRIRKIAKDGRVSTVAGSTEGFGDGIGPEAQFDYPSDLVLDANGNLFVADTDNHVIRQISPQGKVTTVAGRNLSPPVEWPMVDFENPYGIGMDGDGQIFVVDTGNHLIRKLTREPIE